MKNIIRWQGLVGFAALVGLILTITLVFLDTWIKWGAESALGDATGAEVNIGSVSHSFSPFGVTLEDVQLTDPAQPEYNQLQASQVQADIQLMPLLLNKVIIDDLTMLDVAFHQLRNSPGEVYRQPDESVLPSVVDPQNLPSVDDILANSPLRTTKAAEAAEEAYGRHKAILEQQYAALPSKEKLDEYKTRLEAFKDVDFKDPVALSKAKQEFDDIKDELKKDQQKFKDFKQATVAAKQELGPKFADLKAAPGQDYDQLQALIAGDQDAIKDITTQVLGDKAAMWTDGILSAVKIIAPALKNTGEKQQQQERISGRWIEFDDENPLPDFLIRQADISLKWQSESLLSTWQDITHQHQKLGRPTRFNVDSAGSALWQSFKLDGDFQFTDVGLDAHQTWRLDGVKMQDLPLVNDERMTSEILAALLNSNGNLTIADNQLNGKAAVNFADLSMKAQGTNKVTNTIANVLNNLNALNIDADLAGTFDDPDIRFRSDLDKHLATALVSNLTPEQQGKLQELKQKLQGQASGPLANQEAQENQLLQWQQLADGNLESVEDLLNAQFTNALDQKKDKVADKLKKKLFGN